jgi:hypothetical protein
MNINELKQDFDKYSNEWSNSSNYNNHIYNVFLDKVNQIEVLSDHDVLVAKHSLGFGERAFRYLWALVLSQMPQNGRFLEIGVYKGSILSLSQLISNELNLKIDSFGVTPLSNKGDKYSNYKEDDYRTAISFLYSLLNLSENNTTIIEGLSTDEKIKSQLLSMDLFDVIYIDGGHDYETVVSDINLCEKLLKSGGLLVMDDASSFLEFTNHSGFLGHREVGLAIQDRLDNNKNFEHLFACGHNRVWKKM